MCYLLNLIADMSNVILGRLSKGLNPNCVVNINENIFS